MTFFTTSPVTTQSLRQVRIEDYEFKKRAGPKPALFIAILKLRNGYFMVILMLYLRLLNPVYLIKGWEDGAIGPTYAGV